MPTATLQVSLSIALAQQIEAEAARKGVSMSAFVRHLIEAHFAADRPSQVNVGG